MTEDEKKLLLAVVALLVSEALGKKDQAMLDRLNFLRPLLVPFKDEMARYAMEALNS